MLGKNSNNTQHQHASSEVLVTLQRRTKLISHKHGVCAIDDRKSWYKCFRAICWGQPLEHIQGFLPHVSDATL